MLAQDFPQGKYELLIVDNKSTDHTQRDGAEIFPTIPQCPIYYGKQSRAFACPQSWLATGRGEYVAYIDDDCKVPPTWLHAASRVIEQEHPAAFGGPYYAFYNSPKPAWFKDEYGSHVQGREGRLLQAGEYLDGGNLFLRVDDLRRLGGFTTGFGMKGRKIGYGEETELINAWRNQTVKKYIMPRMCLYTILCVLKN